MNLHDLVRAAITSIHPDENCLLVQAMGQTNIKGVITQSYGEPLPIVAQWQPSPQRLDHYEKMSDTMISYNVYLYSDISFAVEGQTRRPIQRGGDWLYRNVDNCWYLITQVSENWSTDGWASVIATQQMKGPEGVSV